MPLSGRNLEDGGTDSSSAVQTISQDDRQNSMVSAILSAGKLPGDPETAPFSVGDLMSLGDGDDTEDATSTNEVASIDHIPLIRDDSISSHADEVTAAHDVPVDDSHTDTDNSRFTADTGPLPGIRGALPVEMLPSFSA